MKFLKELLAVLVLVFTPSAFAQTLTCQEIDVKDEYIRDDYFRFLATTECTLKDSNLQISDVYNGVQDVLDQNGTLLSQKPYSGPDGLSGLKLKYKDGVYDSGWGTISTRYNAFLVFNTKKVSYLAKARAFEATRYAKSLKKLRIAIDYFLVGNVWEIKLRKIAKVTIPDHAPTRYFLYETRTALRKEMVSFVDDFTNFLVTP